MKKFYSTLCELRDEPAVALFAFALLIGIAHCTW